MVIPYKASFEQSLNIRQLKYLEQLVFHGKCLRFPPGIHIVPSKLWAFGPLGFLFFCLASAAFFCTAGDNEKCGEPLVALPLQTYNTLLGICFQKPSVFGQGLA